METHLKKNKLSTEAMAEQFIEKIDPNNKRKNIICIQASMNIVKQFAIWLDEEEQSSQLLKMKITK